MTDVSVIIVSYNTAELTAEAVESVYRETKKVSFEIILVDNASGDGSADLIAKKFPGVNLIRLDLNAGFAAANNLAAEKASGRYILLLNPDTVILDRAMDTLVSWADEHPEWGVYGGSTFFADGRRNFTAGWMKPTVRSMFFIAVGLARLFPRSKIFNPESLEGRRWDAPFPVDIVTGCFLLMRKTDWNGLGGFDERFFMYGEDADLCLRAAEAGLDPVLAPQARIIHYGGASEPVRSDKMVRLFRAKAQLFRAHYKPAKAAALLGMMKLWCAVRVVQFTLAAPMINGVRERKIIWIGIWRRRCEWHSDKVKV